MAKDSPWFKFKVNAWNTGDIHLLSFHLKGVFIDLCSYYWSKECQVKRDACEKKVNRSNFAKLVSEGIVKINGDMVVIEFLNEQWAEVQEKSQKNSNAANERWGKNGEKTESGRIATAVQSVSNRYPNKKRGEEIRKEESYLKSEENSVTAADGIFIRVGTNTVYQSPSQYFKDANSITFDQWKMKNPHDASFAEKVFKKMDDEYVGYDFADDNHVKRTFFSLLEKFKGSPAKNQSLPGSTVLEGSYYKKK